jgi:MFS family permease
LSQGLIVSSVLAVAIFARPAMGRVSDKIGRRAPIIFGCFLSALVFVAVPYTTNFATLIVLLVIYGFGFATVTSATSPLICELVPEELVGAAMGFLDTMMDVGQTLGGFISGLMFATSLHSTGVFLSFAIVMLSSYIVFELFRNWEKVVTLFKNIRSELRIELVRNLEHLFLNLYEFRFFNSSEQGTAMPFGNSKFAPLIAVPYVFAAELIFLRNKRFFEVEEPRSRLAYPH